MRIPNDPVLGHPRVMRRYQIGILVAVAAVIILILIVQGLANLYTNYLWYRSINLTTVWRSMAETRLALAAVFCGAFFIACWLSLYVVDLISPSALYLAPELELVRRYQATFGRYRVSVRTIVSLVLALAVGAGTNAQWQHWLLFIHSRKFGVRDPEFHKDVGYFVFRLPWLSFLVDWSLVALIVLLVVTLVAHYLNGGIRTSGPPPRVDSRAAAHISFLLALIALVRAAGYFFIDRYALDLSNNGAVTGAGYTDVHVRLPALTLLAVVSMVAFVLFSFNLYQRSSVLPAATIGLWVFVAIVLGYAYPAVVQWLRVRPAESTLELPYISRNITATRDAFGLGKVTAQPFLAQQDLAANDVNANRSSLDELPLWDPQVAAATYDNLQALHGYYSLAGLSTDRYQLGTGASSALTPVVVGTRQILPSGEPRQSWVNTHLEYTHGYGVVLSPANTTGASGKPVFDIGGAPVTSTGGAPKVTQPDIYFGTSGPDYAIVDTRQPELDYEASTGSKPVTNSYEGRGGVQLTGFWQRAAFAMRFHDLNLLVSKLVTPQSRILYFQNIDRRVSQAAPF
ncbi:MAG: UPF0182 family protein, partial [Acidimicrobiales bacterium]